MSTTTSNETRAIDFAAAVRGHLADLSTEEVEDLTDGLEADLADRLADGGEFGDAERYAEELRQAAGLPPRAEAEAEAKRHRPTVREAAAVLRDGFVRFWDATPGRRAVRDFAASLRPVWWVLRGLVGAWVLMVWVLHSGFGLLGIAVAAALVLVSIQWGRGKWARGRWQVWLRRIANGLAVVLVIPVLAHAWNAVSTPQYIDYGPDYLPGLTSNGGQITNIFAYDCMGNPLDGVRLYDQDGAPITTRSSDGWPITVWSDAEQATIFYQRNGLAEGNGEWNAFPLREGVENPYNPNGEPDEYADAEAPKSELPPLSRDCPVPKSGAVTEQGGADAAKPGETVQPDDAAKPESATPPASGAAGSAEGGAEHAQ